MVPKPLYHISECRMKIGIKAVSQANVYDICIKCFPSFNTKCACFIIIIFIIIIIMIVIMLFVWGDCSGEGTRL